VTKLCWRGDSASPLGTPRVDQPSSILPPSHRRRRRISDKAEDSAARRVRNFPPCAVGQISGSSSRVLLPDQEGRFAIVTNVGLRMRWTRYCQLTSGKIADGEVVWSRHPDADAKSALMLSHHVGDGGNKAGLRGEHEVSRKPFAQGRPDRFGVPVVYLLVSYLSLDARLRVRHASGFPCALYLPRATRSCKARANHAPRMRRCV
jgi:hypothetical protein